MVLAVLLSSPACAWNYAAQEPPEESNTSNSADDPNVVEIEQSGDDSEGDSEATGDSNSAASAARSEPDSPCGVETFAIHYYDKTSRVTKRIDCLHRKVVSVNRTPISQQRRTKAERVGLPESTWYVLVDPKGIRSKYLTKDQLMKIQREFDLQFLGRDKQRNLLIYEYRGNL